MRNNLTPPTGNIGDLFKIIIELCAKSYYWDAKEFDIKVECEANKMDPEIVKLLFNELLQQGYIYQVKPGRYSIFSPEEWSKRYERFGYKIE